jgi:transcriptional regulator with XRE-family HTH domain
MSVNLKTCFPQRLRELRKEKGLKQNELADQFSVCKSAVSGWEVGRNQPSYDVLIQMSIYFGVSVDYLIGRRNY